jgi:hypothetical protein
MCIEFFYGPFSSCSCSLEEIFTSYSISFIESVCNISFFYFSVIKIVT